MAGDWIKWIKGLADKPEIVRMAAALKLSRDDVAGKLMRFWSWCDDNISEEGLDADGNAVIDLSPLDDDRLTQLIDGIAGWEGFAAGMEAVRWLTIRAPTMILPHFGRHNGSTAKTRSRNSATQTALRKRKQSLDTVRTPTVQKKHEKSVPNDVSPLNDDKTMTREEKRREDTNTLFGDFWKAYPLKKAKEAAKKAFTKLKPTAEEFAVMLAAIERQKAEKAALQKAGAFCPEWPHASTWLNGRRWEDEPASQATTPEGPSERERLFAESAARQKQHAEWIANKAQRKGAAP